MSLIGNFLWFIFGGVLLWLAWLIAGLLCLVTIIGIPLAVMIALVTLIGLMLSSLITGAALGSLIAECRQRHPLSPDLIYV